MRFIDEYRNPMLADRILSAITALSKRIAEPVTIMEICGSHTYAIGRFGIREMLPPGIRLISGPGCPVCVTSAEDIDKALFLAGQKNIIFATFGDMFRVPGSNGATLQKIRASGSDIRIISSAGDCIRLAQSNGTREVVMMGIGFETTSPTVAAAVESCRRKGITNFSVFSVHKVIPPAILALMEDPDLKIDGFICPGHVSTIIGSDAYKIIPQSGRAAVITGFEPVDILEGILMILRQIADGRKEVSIQYGRGVNPAGNRKAMDLLETVFFRTQSQWRGLGRIADSGLRFRAAYSSFDAVEKFCVPEIHSEEVKGCSCGDVLRGKKIPQDCRLFGKLCSPANPVGPCMVSSEGTCAAYYNYHRSGE
ncbi:MAG: hydrogenase formation protein HypD [Syntrophales bacterium]